MKHIVNFHDAMTLVLIGLIATAYVICLAYDRIKLRAERWYAVNHPVNPLQDRPWYVRFYEIVNS